MLRFFSRQKKKQRHCKALYHSSNRNRLRKKSSNRAVALINASSDLIHPARVAQFLVEAVESICLDRNYWLRIRPEWVKLGNDGGWDLGLFKYNPHSQPLMIPPSIYLEGIEAYTRDLWSLRVLESLLQGYIQRSCLRLRRKRTSSEIQFWLICLIQMAYSLRYFLRSEGALEDCLMELKLKLDGWNRAS